jgi:transposase
VILAALDPFKENLAGVVVESTYNWYWLVDGLQEQGFRVHLANPAAIQQYNGLKHTDDQSDAFWLAQLLQLNILPEGYIYPKEQRPVRDLLRRRLLLVRQRTAHILSLESMLARNLGLQIRGNKIKSLTEADLEQMLAHPYLVMAAKSNRALIHYLTENIRLIEKEVKQRVKLMKSFEALLSIPGIGDVLGVTIMLEVGDIGRFPQVGNYSSYCRCVKSERISNGKKKSENNRKNGNKYLAWAYVEAANFGRRFCPGAERFYQRKLAKTNSVVAIKALANKIARASYFLMRDQVPFDEAKLFG